MKLGDVVRLKSGGAHMTVTSNMDPVDIEPATSISCIWLNMAGTVERYVFVAACLEPVVLVDARPPRTGYRDERGVFHPGPGSRGYVEHQAGCESCRKEQP